MVSQCAEGNYTREYEQTNWMKPDEGEPLIGTPPNTATRRKEKRQE